MILMLLILSLLCSVHAGFLWNPSWSTNITFGEFGPSRTTLEPFHAHKCVFMTSRKHCKSKFRKLRTTFFEDIWCNRCATLSCDESCRHYSVPPRCRTSPRRFYAKTRMCLRLASPFSNAKPSMRKDVPEQKNGWCRKSKAKHVV